jgi:hypothetical protein
MAKTATKTTGYSRFLHDVAEANERVLILDYDGTIAPYSAHSRQAYPYPGVTELLHHIMRDCQTRLIVASGRAAHELIPLIGMIPPPEVWGTHGAERVYADGRYEEIEVTEEAMEVLLNSETRLEREGLGHLLEVRLKSCGSGQKPIASWNRSPPNPNWSWQSPKRALRFVSAPPTKASLFAACCRKCDPTFPSPIWATTSPTKIRSGS